MELTPGGLEELIKKSANFIKRFESFSDVVYKDSVGVLTIGYGTTDPAIIAKHKFIAIDKDEAQAYLEQHIKNKVIDKILPLIKTFLCIDQLVPIVSLVYNIGVGNFKESPLLKAINKFSNMNGIAKGFIYHCKGRGNVYIRGLLNRRLYELYYFRHRTRSKINFYRLSEDEVQAYVSDIKNDKLPF